MEKTVDVLLDGYQVTGIFGHWEPFRNTRTYKVTLNEENLNELKTMGSTTLYDFPFKDAYTDIDGNDNEEIFFGECFAKSN